jgi:hypothetical protein
LNDLATFHTEYRICGGAEAEGESVRYGEGEEEKDESR